MASSNEYSDEFVKEDEPREQPKVEQEDDRLDPNEVAEYLTSVYRDPEVSNFEKLNAACALMNFWTAVQVSQLSETLDNFIAVPVAPMPMPQTQEKML